MERGCDGGRARLWGQGQGGAAFPLVQVSKRPNVRPQDALRGGGEREQAESGPPAPNTGQEAVLPRAGRELWRPQGPEKGTDQGFGRERNHPSCLAPQGGERWQHLFLLEPSPAPLPAHSLGFRWQHRGLRGQRGGDGPTLRDAQAAAAPHPSGNETQGVLGTCGPPSPPRPAPPLPGQLRGWLPRVQGTVPAGHHDVMASAPAGPTPQPLASYLVGQGQSSPCCRIFPFCFPHPGQREATGRPQSNGVFFLEPDGKDPSGEFLCNGSPAATRVGGSRPGPGWVARWPASSRGGLGSGGPGRPASCPRRVPAAVLHAGAPVRLGRARRSL